MDGLDDRDLSFVFGEKTQVYRVAQLLGEMSTIPLVIALRSGKISKINGCKLTRIGTLGFDYKWHLVKVLMMIRSTFALTIIQQMQRHVVWPLRLLVSLMKSLRAV